MKNTSAISHSIGRQQQTVAVSLLSIAYSIVIGMSALAFPSVSFSQSSPSNADYTAIPPGSAIPNKPNVILNLSVETPMQGSAYNDQFDDGELTPAFQCTGQFARANYGGVSGSTPPLASDTDSRTVGRCFHLQKEYLGYFDQNKCYNYSSSDERFNPIGPVNSTTNRTCSSGFSGNFLNWATMTSIDGFRHIMTGGMRSTDTTSETVLQRTYINKSVDSYHPWFPVKGIFSNISSVTPFTGSQLFITKYSDTGNPSSIENLRIKFGTSPNIDETNPLLEDVTVRVKVCDSTIGLEPNCTAYEDADGNITYKPTGLIQEFANQMRFSLFTYLNDDDIERQGGVMRARMKDVGPIGSDEEGRKIINLNPEWDEETGIYIDNPDADDATNFGNVSNSGVMNYLNKFGVNGYKQIDPVGEMFYECLRYYRNMPPTTDAVSNLNAARRDEFPVIIWDPATEDPIQQSCQKNYIVGLNDVYAHRDKRVPGTSSIIDSSGEGDQGSPDASDTLDATLWTNAVGQNEYTGPLSGFTIRGVNDITAGGTVDKGTRTNELGSSLDLGRTFITGRSNSYYAAGMALWANTNNIRPDLGTDESPVTVQTFFVDSQEFQGAPTVGPENVLYLAAKYGGFVDQNDNGVPDLDSEWNQNGNSVTIDNSGNPNDGTTYKLPDNYAVASNPQAMEAGLRNAFSRIAAAEERSGTAPANLSNTDDKGGLLVQGLYFQEQSSDDNTEQVTWVGQLHTFFVDEFGLFRDDSGTVANTLDDDDKVFFYTLDNNQNPPELKIQRYLPRDNSDNQDSALVAFGPLIDLDDLETIWSAQEILAGYDNDTITAQRNYNTAASSSGASRYIFTTTDQNFDGTGDQVDFLDTMITPTSNLEILDPPGSTAATRLVNARDIVNYIRGYEHPTKNYRNRTLNAGTNNEKIYRLGDIVNSTPIIVAGPEESYDTELGDVTYGQFIDRYKDRREVLYAGGNDGLIHAFNIGFRTGDANTNVGFSENGPGSETNHELGAELWAYAPHNLLPHLKWLTDLSYSHVFYADGKMQTYDAQIFDQTGDPDHPGGWGTILIAGMRLGGGDYGLDTNNDGNVDYTTRSAYVILDITNPEEEPRVLAEITDPDLNFTTSAPTLDKDIPNGEWTLVFGSGPDSTNFNTSETAKIFTLDISDLGQRTNPLLVTNIVSADTTTIASASKSFLGDFIAHDWDRDYTDDVIYVGTVGEETQTIAGNPVEVETGSVFRYIPRPINGVSGVNLLLDTDRPVQSAPYASFANGKQSVFFGTGRFYHEADAITPVTTYQERYYGVHEPDTNNDNQPEYSAAVVESSLVDVTNIQVRVDNPLTTNIDESGEIVDPDNVTATSSTPVTNTTELREFITQETGGWVRDLPNNGATPSDRVFTDTNVVRGLLFFTAFAPNDNLCEASSGTSDVYGLDLTTGTATGFGIFGDRDGDGFSDTALEGLDNRASEVVLFTQAGSNLGRGFVQGDDGTITNIPVQFGPLLTPSVLRRSWREILFD